VLPETYAANDCVNQLLLPHVDARAWCASPESKDKDPRLPEFSRLSKIKNSAPHLQCPAPLDPAHGTLYRTARAGV